jgi:hypothetical protein
VVVVVFKTLPVGIELFQAVGVDVLDPVTKSAPSYLLAGRQFANGVYIHTCGAAGDLAALLETFKLSPPIGFGLALHIIIVVGLAAVSDKEGCAHQWSRGGADFLDLRDALGHRRRVDENVLVEPMWTGG